MTEQVLTPIEHAPNEDQLTTELAVARKANTSEYPTQANEVVNENENQTETLIRISNNGEISLTNLTPLQTLKHSLDQAVTVESPLHIAGMGDEVKFFLSVKNLEQQSVEFQLAVKAKLLCTLGWRMAQCGAETRLIVQSVKAVAQKLGCSSIDMSLTREGIIIKLRQGNKICVEFKEIKGFSINMDSLDRLHKICLKVISGELTDPKKIYLAIRAVRPRHYQHNHLIVIEALAGACFAYLNGGNFAVCASAFIGGLFLMYARFKFIKRGFFEAFVFMLAAFIGSLVAMLTAHYVFNAPSAQVVLAATATTLLLVPGFPLINGFLDIFKGYVPVGLTRMVIAFVLVVAAAVGLLVTTYMGKAVIDLIPVTLSLDSLGLETIASLAALL